MAGMNPEIIFDDEDIGKIIEFAQMDNKRFTEWLLKGLSEQEKDEFLKEFPEYR